MSKSKISKANYPAVLRKPIKLPGLINRGADPERYIAYEQGRRLALLCDFYGISRDQPLQLARKLATTYIPGFSVDNGNKRGPKLQWPTDRLLKLVAVVDDVRRARKINKREACKHIATNTLYSREWGRSNRSQTVDQWVKTLVARYHDGQRFNRNLGQQFRN